MWAKSNGFAPRFNREIDLEFIDNSTDADVLFLAFTS